MTREKHGPRVLVALTLNGSPPLSEQAGNSGANAMVPHELRESRDWFMSACKVERRIGRNRRGDGRRSAHQSTDNALGRVCETFSVT